MTREQVEWVTMATYRQMGPWQRIEGLVRLKFIDPIPPPAGHGFEELLLYIRDSFEVNLFVFVASRGLNLEILPLSSKYLEFTCQD